MSFTVKNSHPKIIETIQRMLIDLKHKMPFYGEYNLYVNFHERKDIPTAGVNVTHEGMNFYWNKDFIDGLTQKQTNFLVIHEDFHLLFNHPKRTVTGKFDHTLSNIAQDMIINTIIWEDISHDFVEIPKDEKGNNSALFIPKEYTGEPIFEELYMFLKEKRDEKRQQQQSQSQCQSCDGTGKKQCDDGQQGQGKDGEQSQNGGDGQPQDQNQNQQGEGEGQGGSGEGQQDSQNGEGGSEPCPDCGGNPNGTDGNGNPLDSTGKPAYGNYGSNGEDCYSLDHILDNMDENEGQFMDSHIKDTVPDELRETIVKDTVERLKARGLTNGNVEQTLNKLRKKRKDYLREIKRSVSNIIFGTNKIETISKPNRRGIKGLKGNKKIKSKINVILDVSGSMSGLHEKILNYVYRNDISVNMIQADTQVNDFQVIDRTKKMDKLKLIGFGGTCLNPAIRFIEKHKDLNKFNTVV